MLATVNAPNVRLRSAPTVNADMKGYAQTGQVVEILERSSEREAIGDWNNYWYKVKTAEGLVLWCYGEFLDIDN